MENEPNYSNYSRTDLEDVKKHIDKENYPERYKRILELLADPNHNPKEKESVNDSDWGVTIEARKYSTFWPRFWAAIIDGLLTTALLSAERLVFGMALETQNLLIDTVDGIQIVLYTILMHGYFGQTVGKMIMQVKVVDHETESQIGLSQAALRDSVTLFFQLTTVVLVFTTGTSIDTTQGYESSFPFAITVLGFVALIWLVMEFLTMLADSKRRALHDLIGRTVVIRLDENQ